MSTQKLSITIGDLRNHPDYLSSSALTSTVVVLRPFPAPPSIPAHLDDTELYVDRVQMDTSRISSQEIAYGKRTVVISTSLLSTLLCTLSFTRLFLS